MVLEIVTTCGSCKRVIKPIRDAEMCWYCGDDLCIGCWDAIGHCGHPTATAINELAAKGPVMQADLDDLMERHNVQNCQLHGNQFPARGFLSK